MNGDASVGVEKKKGKGWVNGGYGTHNRKGREKVKEGSCQKVQLPVRIASSSALTFEIEHCM